MDGEKESYIPALLNGRSERKGVELQPALEAGWQAGGRIRVHITSCYNTYFCFLHILSLGNVMERSLWENPKKRGYIFIRLDHLFPFHSLAGSRHENTAFPPSAPISRCLLLLLYIQAQIFSVSETVTKRQSSAQYYHPQCLPSFFVRLCTNKVGEN